jgi:hypothetical protein
MVLVRAGPAIVPHEGPRRSALFSGRGRARFRAANLLGMAHGHLKGDPSAHAVSHHVCTIDVKVLEQARHIV